jgi:hypothetical protein
MKKLLSLALSFAVSSLGLVALAAKSARAQQVASAGVSISKIKEEYERLLAVDRDPSTEPDVREMNRKFLEERRAQLRTAIETRLGALRKYQASMSGTLSPAEGLVVNNSIQALERDLSAIAGEQNAPSGPAKVAARARLINASRPSPPAETVNDSKPDAGVTTAGADVAATTPDAAAAPAPLPPPPITLNITSPTTGVADTFATSQVVLTITPTAAINKAEVKVENGGKAVGSPKSVGWSATDYNAAATKVKTVVLDLSAGANTITVTVNDPAGAYNPTTKAVTYAAPAPAAGGGGGGAGGAGGAGGGGAPAPSVTLERPTLTQPKEDDDVIKGAVPASVLASKTAEVEVTIDGDVQSRHASINGDGSYSFTSSTLTLKRGQVIRVRAMDGDKVSPFEEKTVILQGETRSPLDGAATGLVFGGAVMSQQAQEFQQADPFFGFIAGYRFPVMGRKIHYDTKFHPLTTAVCKEAGNARPGDTICGLNAGGSYDMDYHPPVGATCVDPGKSAPAPGNTICPLKIDSDGNPEVSYFGRLHVRFQGIFTATPRTASPNATATPTPTPTGTPLDVTDFKPFIASRKSFETEVHAWFDMPLSKDFFIGPYGAWGASTVLDRNELAGEKIAVEPTNSTGTGNANPSTPAVDGSQVKTDNDIKQYRELGLHASSLLFNRKVFLETILARGWYEALGGLYAGKDTRRRFIGKLRIFPSGLSTTFGEQVKLAPMFGVDLNAGRGPDQLRFFTGFAIRIRGLQ